MYGIKDRTHEYGFFYRPFRKNQITTRAECWVIRRMGTGGTIPPILTEWRTKCHTIDCARNTFLLLQKHLTSGTELILIGWKIVPNEEHVQCDHRFASQPLANEPLHSSQLFDTSLQKARGTTSLCGP